MKFDVVYRRRGQNLVPCSTGFGRVVDIVRFRV